MFGEPGYTVRVTSMLEALGDQPWYVLVIPGDPQLATQSYIIEAASGLGAASDALADYKEKHGLNPTTTWQL